MPNDLATPLETQRSKLLEEFLGLQDLRPGSITAVTRRCGKPSCHCAKHNDPGHDPQFRLDLAACPARRSRRAFSNLHDAAQGAAGSGRVSPLPEAQRGLGHPSTNRSVDSVQSSSNAVAGPSRKKNGCCDPSRRWRGK